MIAVPAGGYVFKSVVGAFVEVYSVGVRAGVDVLDSRIGGVEEKFGVGVCDSVSVGIEVSVIVGVKVRVIVGIGVSVSSGVKVSVMVGVGVVAACPMAKSLKPNGLEPI